MVNYLFHIEQCGTELRDERGTQLIDTASALQAAIKLAWKVMANEVGQGRLCLSCKVIIENCDTGERLTVPFRDTLKLEGL